MPRLSTWSRNQSRLHPSWTAEMGDHVIDLSWSPSGSLIAAASVSGPIAVIDPKDGSEKHRFPGHGFGTTALAWLGDATLVSAGQDGMVRWWAADTGQAIRSTDGGGKWVELLAPARDGERIVSAAGRALRLWTKDGTLLRDYPNQPSTISAIRWRPGSDEFVTAGYGGMSVWSPSSDQPIRRFEWKGSILTVACSPNGRYLATGNQDSTVHFWYYETGDELQMWGYPTKIRELAWDRSSRFLATGGGFQVIVWDCSGKGPSGTKPLSLIGHDEETCISVLAYQSKGDTLASGGTDGRVILWNPVSGSKSVAEIALPDSVSTLEWSPDERSLAVGDASGGVVLLVG